ncbi:MAG TPA: polysaccharide deacetylase family protein [Gemmatimonadales bacterium]|nr:polysaccharide deacetylase family protein [Gemmatimonadales bacterium]
MTGARFLLMLLIAGSSPLGAQEGRRLALTFDDLPVAGPVPRADRAEVFARLLGALKNERVPAIGFVNESQFRAAGKVDGSEVAWLRAWLGAGLELGNHTFSHSDLHRMTLAAYETDVLAGDSSIRSLLREEGKSPRYFRHPYLHTGRSLAVRDSLVDFLQLHGYLVAPVTDDNSDWIYAAALERALARQDSTTARRIREAYVPYMEEKLEYWERQSVTLFGREIPQILLLHANRLNADGLGALLAMIRGRGYRLISLTEALRDSAWTTPDLYAGPAGISWLHRWALSRDRHSVLREEPAVPPWVLEAAGVESE